MQKQITCHKAAVFSDIHSNYYAFRSCYEDALDNGADCFIFLGDYISDLADPVKTLDLVYEIQANHPTVCLRGNREAYMLDFQNGLTHFDKGSKSGSLLFTFEQLRSKDFAFIRSLPIHDRICLNGVSIEIAHAVKDNDRYYFDAVDGRIGPVLEAMEHPFLLTGHSHKQYRYNCNGKTILNPGSVGVHQGGCPLAQYALLDVSGDRLHCQFQQIPYDISATIHAQFENGLVDYAKYWATSILYDIITGKDYTIELLSRVHQRASDHLSSVFDERLWYDVASEMEMRFTEHEILDFLYAQK